MLVMEATPEVHERFKKLLGKTSTKANDCPHKPCIGCRKVWTKACRWPRRAAGQ